MSQRLKAYGVSFLLHALFLTGFVWLSQTNLYKNTKPLEIDLSLLDFRKEESIQEPKNAQPKTDTKGSAEPFRTPDKTQDMFASQEIPQIPANTPRVEHTEPEPIKSVPVEEVTEKPKTAHEQAIEKRLENREPEPIKSVPVEEATEKPKTRHEQAIEKPKVAHEQSFTSTVAQGEKSQAVASEPAGTRGSKEAGAQTSANQEGSGRASKAIETSYTSSEEEQRQLYLKEKLSVISQIIQKNISYPPIARRMGWEGRVVLSIRLCTDGTVKEIKVLESSGYEVLDRNAVDTVRRVAGLFPKPPVEVVVKVPVNYRLE